MRNLINFIWRYNFTLFFLLLELFAFFLIIQNNRFHQANFFSWTNSVSGAFYSVVTDISDYLELKRVNEDLSIENAKLKSLSTNSFIKLRGPHVYIEDSVYYQQYKYLSAKVVNNTIYKRNNYITLNQGSEQGVKPEMGVIHPSGVVGIVKDVSPHFCSVISILNKQTKLSVKFKRNNFFGILTWNGNDPSFAAINNIPNHVEIGIGDTLVSFGSSAIFPEGILVGTIDTFEKVQGDDFYDIRLKLSTQFGNLSYVYIIKNLLKKEQLELEELTKDDV